MAGKTASAEEMARISNLSEGATPYKRTTGILRVKFRCRVRHRCPPGVERGQGPLALHTVPLFLIADFLARLFFERLEQIESDVGGLKIFGIGVGDVVNQGTHRRGARNRRWLFAP